MVWWDPEYLARHMEEGDRSNMELAHEADEAIARLLGTDEHDAATEALCRVIEARDGTGDNPLAVLETLSRSEAISWQALHDNIVGLAEVLRTGLRDYTSGDGSVRAEHEDQDAYFTWHTLADVNRAVSAVTVSVFALATARPLLRNLAWAANILLGTPMRAGIWLADTFDTGPADRTPD